MSPTRCLARLPRGASLPSLGWFPLTCEPSVLGPNLLEPPCRQLRLSPEAPSSWAHGPCCLGSVRLWAAFGPRCHRAEGVHTACPPVPGSQGSQSVLPVESTFSVFSPGFYLLTAGGRHSWGRRGSPPSQTLEDQVRDQCAVFSKLPPFPDQRTVY